MYHGATVGVVVPAYNEESFVGEVIETLPEYVDRIYAIDDASTDATWLEIRAAAERVNARARGDGPSTRRVVPIQHERNRGVGGAIKTGYLRAKHDGLDVVAVMGGDGQMDPGHLPAVLEPVVSGSAEYAKGNRLLAEAGDGNMPRFRLVGNLLLTYLTRIASGYWHVGDPQNGYAAISSDALEDLEIEQMFEYYGYCNDLLVRLSVHSCRVVDVPIPARYGDEESHIEYHRYVPVVSLLLLRLFVWRLVVRRDGPTERARTALFVGGALGVVAAGFGLVRSVLRDPPSAPGLPTSDHDVAVRRRRDQPKPSAERSWLASPDWVLTSIIGLVAIVLGMAIDAWSTRSRNGVVRRSHDPSIDRGVETDRDRMPSHGRVAEPGESGPRTD